MMQKRRLPEKVTHITGTLVQDSTITSKGGTIFNIIVTSARGSLANAKPAGQVTIYIHDCLYRGLYGDLIDFDGIRQTKDENFFYADSMSIMKRGIFSKIRARMLVFAERRIMTLTNNFRSNVDVGARSLAMKLFFGRNSSDVDDGLKLLINKTGLAYVFALSGMHLSAISGIIKRILEKKVARSKFKFLVIAIVALYFFFASRNSAFIRAFLSFLISFWLPKPLVFPFTFLLHNILFPLSVFSLSFDYSYIAIAGIIFFYNPLCMALAFIFGKLMSSYSSIGLSAVSFSAIISVYNGMGFMPMAIFIGPVVAFFAIFFIFLAIGFIIIPKSILFSYTARYAYLTIYKILETDSRLSLNAGFLGYIVFILILILIFLKVELLKGDVLKLKSTN